jgi:hypothetical protein
VDPHLEVAPEAAAEPVPGRALGFQHDDGRLGLALSDGGVVARVLLAALVVTTDLGGALFERGQPGGCCLPLRVLADADDHEAVPVVGDLATASLRVDAVGEALAAISAVWCWHGALLRRCPALLPAAV